MRPTRKTIGGMEVRISPPKLSETLRGPAKKLTPMASGAEFGGEDGVLGAGEAADFYAGGHGVIVAWVWWVWRGHMRHASPVSTREKHDTSKLG